MGHGQKENARTETITGEVVSDQTAGRESVYKSSGRTNQVAGKVLPSPAT